MGASIGIEATEAPLRLLALGNDILADDAFGLLVAREIRERLGGEVDVVCSSAAGFALMDDLLGVSRLLVVDTVLTGQAKPGTIHVLGSNDVLPSSGGSPHYVGLFDVLAVASELGLPVPKQVTVIVVEAADCTTVGGAMTPDVEAAIPAAVELISQMVLEARRTAEAAVRPANASPILSAGSAAGGRLGIEASPHD